PRSAREVSVIETAFLEVDKRSADTLVGIVVPRGRGRCGAAKNPGRHALPDSPPEISAVNGFQTVCPREKHPAETRDPARARILIRQFQMIGPVEQILQSWLRGRGERVDPPAPVTTQVPIGPANTREIRTEHNTDIAAWDLGSARVN